MRTFYKKIPGSTRYQIDLKGRIVDIFGVEQKFEQDHNGYIEIELFGKPKRVELKDLALRAWYETWTIRDLELHWDKIKFQKCKSKILRSVSGYVMYFTEPVHYADGFYYIPSFSRYAMNEAGIVVDTFRNSNDCISFNKSYGYPVAGIYSPDRRGYKHIRFHRLYALTWIPNDDYAKRPYINHKNGVKDDNRRDNLEWCSAEENAQHALREKLTKTQIAMKIRDAFTGEITVFESITDMAKVMGRDHGWSKKGFASKMPGFLYKKRYEIKAADDETPWYYQDHKPIENSSSHIKAFYTIEVENTETGEKRKFNRVSDFYTHFDCRPNTGNIESSITKFNAERSPLKATVRRNACKGPYYVTDLETKACYIHTTIKDSAKHCGIGMSELQVDLARGLKFIYHGKWVVIPEEGDHEFSNYQPKQKVFYPVEMENVATGERLKANSIKAAAREFGFDPKIITKYIDTETEVRGMKFRALKP